MTSKRERDHWVAHRREGWTVESHSVFGPVSTHETFSDACAEVRRLNDNDNDSNAVDGGSAPDDAADG